MSGIFPGSPRDPAAYLETPTEVGDRILNLRKEDIRNLAFDDRVLPVALLSSRDKLLLTQSDLINRQAGDILDATWNKVTLQGTPVELTHGSELVPAGYTARVRVCIDCFNIPELNVIEFGIGSVGLVSPSPRPATRRWKGGGAVGDNGFWHWPGVFISTWLGGGDAITEVALWARHAGITDSDVSVRSAQIILERFWVGS